MSVEYILFDGLYLGNLSQELAALKKSKTARRLLAGRIRETLKHTKRWPSDQAGRAALVLWLLEGSNAELLRHVRLRHRHERIDEQREAANDAARERRSA